MSLPSATPRRGSRAGLGAAADGFELTAPLDSPLRGSPADSGVVLVRASVRSRRDVIL
jgi:hypothetical protein